MCLITDLSFNVFNDNVVRMSLLWQRTSTLENAELCMSKPASTLCGQSLIQLPAVAKNCSMHWGGQAELPTEAPAALSQQAGSRSILSLSTYKVPTTNYPDLMLLRVLAISRQ